MGPLRNDPRGVRGTVHVGVGGAGVPGDLELHAGRPGSWQPRFPAGLSDFLASKSNFPARKPGFLTGKPSCPTGKRGSILQIFYIIAILYYSDSIL